MFIFIENKLTLKKIISYTFLLFSFGMIVILCPVCPHNTSMRFACPNHHWPFSKKKRITDIRHAKVLFMPHSPWWSVLLQFSCFLSLAETNPIRKRVASKTNILKNNQRVKRSHSDCFITCYFSFFVLFWWTQVRFSLSLFFLSFSLLCLEVFRYGSDFCLMTRDQFHKVRHASWLVTMAWW